MTMGKPHNCWPSSDRHAVARLPMMEELLKRGHEIVWLGDKTSERDKKRIVERKAQGNLANIRDLSDRVTYIDDKLWTDGTLAAALVSEKQRALAEKEGKNVSPERIASYRESLYNLPDVDVVLMECLRFPIYRMLRGHAIIDYYRNKVPVFIFDIDLWLEGEFSHDWNAKKLLGSYWKGDEYIAMTPYDEPNKFFKHQWTFYSGYNPEDYSEEILDNPKYLYGYLGSDYERWKQFQTFYAGIAKPLGNGNIHVFGNWKDKEHVAACPDIHFHGMIDGSEVSNTLKNILVQTNIAKTGYEKVGLVQYRILEVPLSGSVLLCDAHIKNHKGKQVLEENMVWNTSDVMKRIHEIREMPYPTRCDLIERQRDLIRDRTWANQTEIFLTKVEEEIQKVGLNS